MESWILGLIIIATAWILVYILGYIFKLDKRLGWTFGPLTLLMRTTRFNNIIKRIAKKHANFWRRIGNISIFFGLILMLASLGLLLYTLIDFFMPNPVISSNGPAVGLIIPGVTISFKTALYLIIPIILVMIPHELAHGVVAHADGVELKSTGLAFFAIFFGAFVEPDEEEILDASAKTKMRTFASGMFPNLILGLITIPVLIFANDIISPFYNPANGILVNSVETSSPASTAGLARGIVISNINTTRIVTSTDFENFMMLTRPNQTINLFTNIGILSNVTLSANPRDANIGYLGITYTTFLPPKFNFVSAFFPTIFSTQIIWIIIVAFGSVLFNALPIPFILDGDKLLSTFLSKYIKNEKIALILIDVFRFLALTLFLANLILPIVRYGLVPII